MYKVNIEGIDLRKADKIKGIYACNSNDKWYIGKSVDLFSRLNVHRIKKGHDCKLYILESYKDISYLDLMVMEDLYICKFEALGYNVENKVGAIPTSLKKLLMGKVDSIPISRCKNLINFGTESKIFKINIDSRMKRISRIR